MKLHGIRLQYIMCTHCLFYFHTTYSGFLQMCMKNITAFRPYGEESPFMLSGLFSTMAGPIHGNTVFFYLQWSGRTSPSAYQRWFLDIGELIMICCWQKAISLQVSTSPILSLEESNPSFPELPSRTHHSATSTCLQGPKPETILTNYSAERFTIRCTETYFFCSINNIRIYELSK